jgi:hypothetical protein
MKVDDAFHGITTLLVSSTPYGQSQGTGFYYQELSPKDPSKDGQWRQIEKVWLVTNRHVVLPKINNNETVPTTFAFHLRKIDGSTLKWEPIILNAQELLERARFHPNVNIDVCIIDVLDLITEKIKSGGTYQNWYAVHGEQHPGQNNINIETADEAVVIGYPRGFYDQVNLFPIVKSGIISTRWGAAFNGNPYFLIDSKLFPGSSGSIVVSMPKYMAFVDGKIMHAKEKQFAFLGIFSGEPYRQEAPIDLDDMTIVRKSSYNLGIVWYGTLVDEIIKDGVKFLQASS